MATLVQFLAAGVKGAESGTATFVLRGTASSAAAFLFNDFERVAQPGTNIITLDANGSAEVYCSVYCDVTLKNSAGATLRTVTIGNSAGMVEVRSDSFTGTDYDGSPANTVSQPITLNDVLDKWNDSAGTTNWKVLSNGVATNLQTALASVAGIFVNVKDPVYGAIGDGVTDDTTAILAANTAAAGGIVFFPAGTYKMTTGSLSGANINWMGAGAGASVISGSTSTNLLQLTDNTNTGWKNFSSLSFTSSGSYSRLFLLEESQNVSFDRCAFDASNCSVACVAGGSTAGLAKYLFTNCDFVIGVSTTIGIFNAAAAASRIIRITGCNFKVPSGYTGTILSGADMVVDGSVFDARAVTSGVYRHIDAEDDTVVGRYVGSFTNSKFIDGGSTGFVFKLTTLSTLCDFSEDGNTFVGFTAPTATAQKGQTYEITDADSGAPGDIHLGSRKGRTIYLSNVAATFTPSACLEAEHVVIEHGVTGLLQVTVPALIPGLSGRVIVYRTAGSGNVEFLSNDILDGYVPYCIISCTDVANGILFASLPAGAAGSCGYITTSRASGVFRSLICGVFEHNIV